MESSDFILFFLFIYFFETAARKSIFFLEKKVNIQHYNFVI